MPPQSSVVRGTVEERSGERLFGRSGRNNCGVDRKAAIGGCNRRLARGTNMLERSCVPPAGL